MSNEPDNNKPPAFMPELNANNKAVAETQKSEAPEDKAEEHTEVSTETAPPVIDERPSEKPSKLDKLRLWWEESPDWYQPVLFGGAALFFILWVISIFWSIEPDLLDVQQLAQDRAGEKQQLIDGKPVVGYTTTITLMEVANTLMDKSGGYLSNDVLPPSVVMDNMPAWEFGVLQQVRLFTKYLRYEISRGQTSSEEQRDLQAAEPLFNIDNTAWMVPAAEGKYKDGVEALERYLDKLADPNEQNAQFYSRADNLREWLKPVARSLGSLSQRLAASVGQTRVNTDLAGDSAAQSSTGQNKLIRARTSWFLIDDVFYEARGTSWALINLLRAIEVDFKDVLEKKNALRSVQQIIRELEFTQRTLWSPMILNGADFGFFANHSLVMSSYVARANAGLIELRDLLARG